MNWLHNMSRVTAFFHQKVLTFVQWVGSEDLSPIFFMSLVLTATTWRDDGLFSQTCILCSVVSFYLVHMV